VHTICSTATRFYFGLLFAALSITDKLNTNGQDDEWKEIIYSVHSPTNALFIKLEKALKFTLKFTLSLLLHVSVYDHHQGAYAGARLKLYYVNIQ
jgi:hypothetical protein